MVDERIKKAASIIVNHSTRIKKGDIVKISCGVPAKPLALEIFKLCIKKGAFPFISANFEEVAHIYYKNASKAQLKKFPELAMHEAKKVDAYINIGGDENTKALTNVDPKKITLRRKVTNPISEHIVNKAKKKWLGFEYPTNALAQDAGMSLEEYEDFVFGAVNIDWKKENKKMYRLARVLDKKDKVRIIGKETDLSFSIKGRHAIPDDEKYEGQHNMPDGETFTSIVEKSTNGHIYYEYPAIYGGNEVSGIRLVFKNGKVVKATAEKNEKFLKQMLNTDKGAKYFGEWGIGLNYGIKGFTGQILFDEKIGGTIHLALGMAYKECKGTNKSALHWDMIKDMRKGQIFLDGKLAFKDGKWLVGYK